MVNKDKTTVLVPASTRTKIAKFFAAGLQRTQAQAVQDPQAFRLGIARRRYREGFTDKEDFIGELHVLQVPEDQVQLEIIAGDLEAAYDYTMDLIKLWQAALRQGHISVTRFAELVASVVVVPERARTYVAREVARLKPEDAPSLAPVPKVHYETDAGKVEVDTIRRQRRKRQLTRGQEITELLKIGVPESLAEAWADNDDIRISKKEEE